VNVSRILAPNPGPFTGAGTNTYVLGSGGEALVIDPGPVDAGHRRAIGETIGNLRPVAVLVTHTHSDHAPLANPLAEELAVAACGFADGPGFRTDRRLAEGDEVRLGSEALQALHTPGHSADHLCFRVGEALFTGDHILGGSSVTVEDMGAYLASLERLRDLPLRRIYPGHGPQIDQPAEVIDGYLRHRREREEQILAAVGGGAATVGAVVESVYQDVDPELHPLAARSVLAHLRKLSGEGRVDLAEGASDSLEGMSVVIRGRRA
jgi:glyoxylase-like metal-dependent hydrolase (beta-lactamase superfamily II)